MYKDMRGDITHSIPSAVTNTYTTYIHIYKKGKEKSPTLFIIPYFYIQTPSPRWGRYQTQLYNQSPVYNNNNNNNAAHNNNNINNILVFFCNVQPSLSCDGSS